LLARSVYSLAPNAHSPCGVCRSDLRNVDGLEVGGELAFGVGEDLLCPAGPVSGAGCDLEAGKFRKRDRLDVCIETRARD
jgi:hypothetical protein